MISFPAIDRAVPLLLTEGSERRNIVLVVTYMPLLIEADYFRYSHKILQPHHEQEHDCHQSSPHCGDPAVLNSGTLRVARRAAG